MATLKQVRVAARELDQADDLVDRLVAEKTTAQAKADELTTQLTAARADRDTKKAAFKILVADLN
jgi:hypothetical protein